MRAFALVQILPMSDKAVNWPDRSRTPSTSKKLGTYIYIFGNYIGISNCLTGCKMHEKFDLQFSSTDQVLWQYGVTYVYKYWEISGLCKGHHIQKILRCTEKINV